VYFVSILKREGKSLKISVIPMPYIRSTKNNQLCIYAVVYIGILFR
jgi:hypothetical protein